MGIMERFTRAAQAAYMAWSVTIPKKYWWPNSSFPSFSSHTGRVVNADSAESLSAFFGCINIIAQSVSVLPMVLYQRNGDDRERAVNHPLYTLLHDQANRHQTAADFKQTMTAHQVGTGNAYAEKVFRGSQVVELLPIEPRNIRVNLDGWDVSYEVRSGMTSWKPIPAYKIFHLRGWSKNGVIGIHPVEKMKETLGEGLASQEHSSRNFKDGIMGKVFVTHPAELSDESRVNLEKSFNQSHGGLDNAYGTVVLEEGAKAELLSSTNRDSQLLELRQFNRQEIASFFRVPPHMIGDLSKANYNTLEQQSLEFIQHCLLYWLNNWEKRAWLDLLLPDEREIYFFEHVVDALARGSLNERMDAYGNAITNGILSRNEVRRKENYPSYPDGDRFLYPMNMEPNPGGKKQ